MNLESDEIKVLKTVYNALNDKFAFDVKIYNIKGKSTLSDFFVISSCNNISQVKACAEHVEFKLKEINIKLKQKEGYQTNKWVLLDFNTVTVHIFNKEDRDFYTLDKVWENCPLINMEELAIL